jgi:hypothetical protein
MMRGNMKIRRLVSDQIGVLDGRTVYEPVGNAAIGLAAKEISLRPSH